MESQLYVHSIESLGALDGPGLRTVIFLSGCPLKCQYCHNPDSWLMTSGKAMTKETLFKKLMRMSPYFKNKGGVTFSGGDPLLQASALIPLVRRLKQEGIHVALDTSGALWSSEVESLIELVDLVLLDVKHTNDHAYRQLTSGNLQDTYFFLNSLIRLNKPYWIRQVVIPTINNTIEQLYILEYETRSEYRQKIELLPYHKKALYKWLALGQICPLSHLPEISREDIKLLINKMTLPFSTFEF